jgi:small conductance mechanosensitive channel
MKEFDLLLKNVGIKNAILQDVLEIAIVLIAIILILAIIRFILSFAIKKGADESAKPLIYSLLSYAVYIGGLLMILHILGVNTAGIVTVIGAASLAIGLALKDTLGNIASGILLLFLKPFRASDYIECGSLKGKIVGVGLFNTILISLDGLFVSAPNSMFWGAPIVNFSRNPVRRLDLAFGIDYADSAEKAMAEMKMLVEADNDVLKKPEPSFYVSSLDDSAVCVNMRVWVKTAKYWDMRCKYMKAVKERFDEVGISIPFPQRVVHIVKE